LSKLFDWRQRGDYDNLVDYDKVSVEPLFVSVKEMIELIEVEIEKTLIQ
jgi:hypothetical protein